MSTESYCWWFVENVPLLFEKGRAQKQLKIETWLDLAQILREIGYEEGKWKSPQHLPKYIV